MSRREQAPFEQWVRAAGHDINNVLSSLLLSCGRLRDHQDPRVAEIAEDMLESIGAARRLTRQLVNLGPDESERNVTRLGDFVASREPMLRAVLAGRGVLSLEIDVFDSAVPMPGTDLEQVLANLCANARDALDGTGSVRILVRKTAAGDGAGSEGVVVEVIDDGRGMDTATLAGISAPPLGTKPSGRGLGLGLVRAAVARAHGELRIESTLGRGTRVVIRLPRSVEH